MFQHFSISTDEDVIARTRWYIHFRWLYILILAVPASLAILFARGWNQQLTSALILVSLVLLSNGVFYGATYILKHTRQVQGLAAALLLTDIFIISFLILTRGGLENRSVILYVMPIIMSAILFGRKGIYTAAVVSVVSYNIIIIAAYLNLYRSESSIGTVSSSNLSHVMYLTVFFSSAMIAASIATDFILKLLRQKERLALAMIEDLKRAQAVGKFGSWEWDIPNDRIEWSDEIFRMLGIKREDGLLDFDRAVGFIHSKDRRRFISEINKARKKPRHFGFDIRIISADNVLRYVRTEGQSITGRSGQVETIIGAARDITEERLLDQTKNEFVSLASHQLRTPATVVKQYLSMLLDGYAGELTDKQRDFLKIASVTNEHQINIINNLLGVAQLESGKIQLTMTQVDIVAMVRSIVEEYSPRAIAKDQSLSFSTRYKTLFCRADEHSLRTVLENILDNAFKYTMPGKAIKIKVSKELNAAVIAVIDQGVGIASQDLPKLFKKFSRIERTETFQEEGTGLGLYWAEKIVTLHGGTIAVESEVGKGTTMKVFLPSKRVSKSRNVRPRRPVAAATG